VGRLIPLLADRTGMRAFRDIMSTQPARQLSIAVGRQHGCTDHAQHCILQGEGRITKPNSRTTDRG
jgi:hypothetical protein